MSDSFEGDKFEIVVKFPEIACILGSIISLSGKPWSPVLSSRQLKFLPDEVNPEQGPTSRHCRITISRIYDNLVFIQRD